MAMVPAVVSGVLDYLPEDPERQQQEPQGGSDQGEHKQNTEAPADGQSLDLPLRYTTLGTGRQSTASTGRYLPDRCAARLTTTM